MTAVRRLLAIDTSGAACSAAVWRDGAVVAHRHRDMVRGHSEALMPMIMETLAEARQELRAIDAIAATVGPGAFTGIRIGLAAARGIGLAAGISVHGVTTFGAVAEAVPEIARRGRRMLVLLDSKRGDLFVQAYDSTLIEVGPPAVMAVSDVDLLISDAPTVIAGDGVGLLRPLIRNRVAEGRIQIQAEGPVDATHVALLAIRLHLAGRPLPPEPLYLRAPDVRIGSSRTEAPHQGPR